MTTLADAATSCWLSFVVVSILLYVAIMLALIFNRRVSPFNSSFFTLWIWLGIIDCGTTIASWVWRNPQLLKWWYYTTLQPVRSLLNALKR